MPKKTYYITRAIDYPNGKPHIGHAYEFVVADALARWHRLADEEVYFLCGADEHGQKIERTAKKANKEPQVFVDENVQAFRDLAETLSITNDDYIRTTETRHIKIAQDIFEQLLKQGDIYKGEYEGLYCTGCEAFYTVKDLIEAQHCSIHKTPVERIKEESYFFKLSKYQDELRTFIESHPDFILPKGRREEILNQIKEGLKDISVSRTSITWGIPVRSDPKHVIYVWVDALPNYITALGYPDGKLFKKFWPADVHIVGKDINRFHTVIWPALLLALKIDLPRTVHSHGFVNFEGEKLSKSAGNIVDPFELCDAYGADALRYYLLREIPAGEDGDYTEQSLVERANADLADGVGNLLNRVSTLVHKHFGGKIPKPTTFLTVDNDLIKQSAIAKEVDVLMQKYEWHKAVERIWEFVRYCNRYLSFTEPWKHTTEKERLATVLYSLVESLRIISILISPFVPTLADKVSDQIDQKIGTLADAEFQKTTKGTLKETKPVFRKLEKPKEHPFARLNLKVAKVESAIELEGSDKLLILHVNLGNEHRQIVAGLKKYYKPEDLKGKHVVIVSNLKPAKLRGVESQGMVLAAEKGDKVKVLLAPAEEGELVTLPGVRPTNQQITINEFSKIKLEVKNKRVLYDGEPLRTNKGAVTVEIEDGATIK